MQKKAKQKKPVELVYKPIVAGSWHGRDAWRMAAKRALGFVGITLLYLITGALLSFENAWLRLVLAVMIVAAVSYYQYAGGVSRGQSDAAYGEIIYNRRENGHTIPQQETLRSFHKFKGFFAVLVGCAPFVLFALVFACMTGPVSYTLGVLPSWTENLLHHTEFGAGLAYYSAQSGMSALSIMRIIDRAMVMPFVNVASAFDSHAILLVERLSPILLLITPIWYSVGYSQGLACRARINTGIMLGDDKKKRRERKERRKRQQSKTPERLI